MVKRLTHYILCFCIIVSSTPTFASSNRVTGSQSNNELKQPKAFEYVKNFISSTFSKSELENFQYSAKVEEIINRMGNFKTKIIGTNEEFKKITEILKIPFSEASSAANIQKTKEAKNSSRSYLSEVRLIYNAIEKKDYAWYTDIKRWFKSTLNEEIDKEKIKFVLNFHNKNNLFTLAILECIRLKEEVIELINSKTLTDNEQFMVATAYFQVAYKTMRAYLFLVNADKTSKSEVESAIKSLQISYEDLAQNNSTYIKALSAAGITKNRQGMAVLNSDVALDLAVASMNMIGTGAFFLKAAKLITIKDGLNALYETDRIAGQTGKRKIPNKCYTEEQPIKFDKYYTVESMTTEDKENAIDNILYDNGLTILPKKVITGTIKPDDMSEDVFNRIQEWENVRAQYLHFSNASPYKGGFSPMLPFKNYFQARNIYEGKTGTIDEVSTFNELFMITKDQLDRELKNLGPIDPESEEGKKYIAKQSAVTKNITNQTWSFFNENSDKTLEEVTKEITDKVTKKYSPFKKQYSEFKKELGRIFDFNLVKSMQEVNQLQMLKQQGQDIDISMYQLTNEKVDNYNYSGLNIYLANQLQNNKGNKYFEQEVFKNYSAINSMKKELPLSFPAPFSNYHYEKWLLSTIYNWIDYKLSQNNSILLNKIAAKICSTKFKKPENDLLSNDSIEYTGLCKLAKTTHLNYDGKKLLKSISDLLYPVKDNNEMIARIAPDYHKYNTNYKLVKQIYIHYNNEILSFAKKEKRTYEKGSKFLVSELEYVVNNKTSTPWGIVKLSLLLLKNKKPHLRKLIDKTLKYYNLSPNLFPDHSSKVSARLGLKKMYAIRTVEEENKKNFNLFNLKSDIKFHNGKKAEFYDLLWAVNRANLTQHKNIEKLFKQIHGSNQLRAEINKFTKSDKYIGIDHLNEIYKNAGNYTKQKELLASLIEHLKNFSSGSDNFAFDSDSFFIKEHFVTVDMAIKTLFYHDIIKKAVFKHQKRLRKSLNLLCSLHDGGDAQTDVEKLDYMTRKAQTSMKETYQIEKPESITDRVGSLSSDERNSLYYGLGSMVPFMLSMMAFSGGTLALPVAIFGGILALAAGGYEYSRYVKGQTALDQVLEAANAGLTSREDAEGVQVTILWTAIEVLGILPFIGLTTRGLKTATTNISKVAMTTGLKSKTKTFFKTLIRNKKVAQQTELWYSRELIGLDGKTGMSKFSSSYLHSKYLFSPLANESFTTIKKSTAKVFGEYFGDNPGNLKRYLMRNYKDILGKKSLGVIPRRGYLKKQAAFEKLAKKAPIGTKWYFKLRLKKFKRIASTQRIKNLKNILSQLDTMIAKKQRTLDDFVEKNIDILDDIVMNSSWRWREVPYRFLILGGPARNKRIMRQSGQYLGNTKSGALVQNINSAIDSLAEGVMAQRIMTSRRVFIDRKAEIMAEKFLGLSNVKSKHKTFEIIKKAQDVMLEKAAASNDQKMIAKIGKHRQVLIGKVRKYWQKNGQKAGKWIRSQTDDDLLEAFAKEAPEMKLAFNNTPAENVITQLKGISEETVGEYLIKHGDYENLSDFAKYLNVLTISTLKHRPDLLKFLI